MTAYYLRSMKSTAAKFVALPLAALVLASLWSLRPAVEITTEPADASFPRVTWSEARPRVEAGEWTLVDAREEEQFNARHIPGAVSLPSHSYPELLAFFAEDHGTAKTVVIYCGTEECDLSEQLAARLRDEAGCTDLRILDGGFLAWQRDQ